MKTSVLRFFIHIRATHSIWGGDLSVIHSLRDGLVENGHEVLIDSQLELSLDFDVIMLTNSCQNKQEEARFLKANGREYFILTFHEDFLGYMPSCIGFCEHINGLVKGTINLPVPATLEYLEQNPSICRYYQTRIKLSGVGNGEVLNNALAAFPSSSFESQTIARDAPFCKAKVVLVPTIPSEWQSREADRSFSSIYDLPKNYILQVGRLEPRKNQIGTVLAVRDLDIPLVFVATAGGPSWYQNLLANVILKYRKYPTYIISQGLDALTVGNLKISAMEERKKLPPEILLSAYLEAAVNVHPAFHELPGLTYLESLALGLPTVCSAWTGVSEYIVGDKPGNGINFVNPESISEIRNATLHALSVGKPTGIHIPGISPNRFAAEITSNVIASL